MHINQLIDLSSPHLGANPTYTEVQKAFEVSNDIHCLPLVDETGALVGSIHRKDFNLAEQDDFQLSEVLNSLYLFDYYHILEALRELMKSGLNHLPVVDENGFYLGMCHLSEVQYHFQQTMGILEAGSMMVIQTTVQNYSLVDVAKIVESNQAKILSHYVSSHPDSSKLEITITLNVSEISDIISTFNRFDYQVNYSSTSSIQSDFLKERYDSLMHFLEI